MRRILRHVGIILVCGAVSLLSACVPPAQYHQFTQAADTTQQQIAAAEQATPTVVTKPGMYVDTTPVALNNAPAWMNQKITMRGNDLPFNVYVTQVLGQNNVLVNYDSDFDKTRTLSLDYSGTVKGALDKLAVATDTSYTLDNNNVINWSRFQNSTFDVSFMPGSSQYLMGRSSQSATNNSSNSSSSSSLSVNNLNATQIESQDDQYSQLAGTLSVWDDLKNALDALKSPDGKIDISQATTTVTVHDHPGNVRAIARYLDSINKEMTRQVQIQVQVLEVTMNKGFNYGINWNLVAQYLGGQMSLGGSFSSLQSISDLNNSIGSSGLGLSVLNGTRRWSNTSLLINALSQQGTVSVATNPRVVTMNNQVAEIGINTLTGYLASQVTTVTPSGTGTATATTLTPGQITDGFTLYVLPKIQGTDIYLQITSTIAKLQTLNTITSTGASNTATTNSSNAPIIQVPTVAVKRFNQRTMVGTGSTLILAGFKQLRNEAQKASQFGADALGGSGGQQVNSETIILITPTIVGSAP